MSNNIGNIERSSDNNVAQWTVAQGSAGQDCATVEVLTSDQVNKLKNLSDENIYNWACSVVQDLKKDFDAKKVDFPQQYATTVAFCLVIGNRIVSMNAGDSEVVIYHENKQKRLSPLHDVSSISDKEHTRVIKDGGYISRGRLGEILAITRDWGFSEVHNTKGISEKLDSSVRKIPQDATMLYVISDGARDSTTPRFRGRTAKEIQTQRCRMLGHKSTEDGYPEGYQVKVDDCALISINLQQDDSKHVDLQGYFCVVADGHTGKEYSHHGSKYLCDNLTKHIADNLNASKFASSCNQEPDKNLFDPRDDSFEEFVPEKASYLEIIDIYSKANCGPNHMKNLMLCINNCRYWPIHSVDELLEAKRSEAYNWIVERAETPVSISTRALLFYRACKGQPSMRASIKTINEIS